MLCALSSFLHMQDIQNPIQSVMDVIAEKERMLRTSKELWEGTLADVKELDQQANDLQILDIGMALPPLSTCVPAGDYFPFFFQSGTTSRIFGKSDVL